MLTLLLYLLALQLAVISKSAAAAQAEIQNLPRSFLIPCEAPLVPPKTSHEHVVSGRYGVYLLPGHTLQEHIEFIQIEITPYIFEIYDKPFDFRVVYGCRDVDDLLLAAIRSDPGVKIVVRDVKVEMDDPSGAKVLHGDDLTDFGVPLRDTLGL